MLRFAIASSSSVAAGRLADDFGQLLAGTLGMPCEIEVCSTFAEVADELLEGHSAIGWLPPFAYVRISRVARVRVLVRAVRADQRGYYSVLFTRADSPLREVAELRGRRVAFVDSMSAAGYLFPLAGLAASGIPEKALGAISFEGSHTKVIQAVVGERADAGATFCTWQTSDPSSPVHSAGWTEGGFIPVPDLRVLVRFGPIPGDALCAGPGLGQKEREDFVDAMTSLHRSPEGARLLRGVFGADFFEPVLPEHYEPVIEAARSIGID